MKIAAALALMTFPFLAGGVAAQTAQPATPASGSTTTPMATPATTVAPTKDGTGAHTVATPVVPPRTTMTGGNTNGGAN